MHPIRPANATRPASAFSSLAVTVVVAALTILALAVGTVQNTKAEFEPGTTFGESPTRALSHHQEIR